MSKVSCKTLKRWRRNAKLLAMPPLAEAKLVFEGQKPDVGVGIQVEHTAGSPREFVQRSVTFWESDLFLRRGGNLVKIEKPFDAIHLRGIVNDRVENVSST